MHAGTQERRRKFYGWGYEGDEVSPHEVVEFEEAWTRLLGVSDFTAVPFPTEDSINLRPSRVKVPASLQAICTTDKYNRLYHTYGASSVDVAYAVRGEFRNPPDAVTYPRIEEDIVKLFHWCESRAAFPCRVQDPPPSLTALAPRRHERNCPSRSPRPAPRLPRVGAHRPFRNS
jgi:alkyldihydroxyacetonephosphate synthase